VTLPPPQRIPIGGGPSESTAWVGSGLLEGAANRLVSASGRFVLVSAAAAAEPAERVRRSLGKRILADVTIPDAEDAKTLETVAAIADAAIGAGLRRDDAFVAVGGGVVTDMVGFAAAILLRGVAWNAVPTTTAGMADAAIGGKTGVNHRLGKNLLGAYHAPAVILVDPSAAATLPERDYRAGLVEAYKDAWIGDASLADRASRRLPDVLARDPEALLDLLSGSVRVKADIVASDPRDDGRRRLLNFGHTLGHALEAAGGFGTLRHGEAVAWGIAAALVLSRKRTGLPSSDDAAVRGVLARLGPFPEPERDPARLAPFLSRDKKATARGLASILLAGIGDPRVDETVSVEEWMEAASIMSLS
jgi:3-dehydroquinate synthase